VSALIMVVDDNESIRRLIRLNLEIEGYEVVEAVDGQHCLDLVGEVRPDLVTIDVVMPRLGGFAAAASLRAEPRTESIPIVMVTTQAQPADRRRAEEIGVDAYVTKPFEPAVLIETIRTVLARSTR
jgi:CheY-like chemotaxis protein